jgi:hypothetical protein
MTTEPLVSTISLSRRRFASGDRAFRALVTASAALVVVTLAARPGVLYPEGCS